MSETVWIYTNVYESLLICTNLHVYDWIRVNLYESLWICTMCVNLYKPLSTCMTVCESVCLYDTARICINLYESNWVYVIQNKSVCISTNPCESGRVCTNLNEIVLICAFTSDSTKNIRWDNSKSCYLQCIDMKFLKEFAVIHVIYFLTSLYRTF